MIYRHSFLAEAPLTDVRAFHARSASMGEITPPPVIAVVQQAPELLGEGDEMAFTLWLGPLPLRWRARIEGVTPNGFDDRQLSGPFAQWVHRHRFTALDDERTRVDDEIEAELSSKPFWRLVGMFMWLNMPVLFAFRGWKTRRLLVRRRSRTGSL